MATTAIDRAWIASEFLKIVDSERSLATDAKARAESPPMPALAVLYHEIADQDERHVAVLKTIATRYGHTPTRSTGGGVGEALTRLKDKVVTLGVGPTDLVRQLRWRQEPGQLERGVLRRRYIPVGWLGGGRGNVRIDA